MSAVKSIVDEVVAVDGSDAPAGGSATPGGDSGQLQYHLDGAFAGVPGSRVEATYQSFEIFNDAENYGANLSLSASNGISKVESLSSFGGLSATVSAGAWDGYAAATIWSTDGTNVGVVKAEPTAITLEALAVLIPTLQNFADDTAARAAGLVDHQLYKSAGVLRIVEPIE
jgi:hypothetical protein